MSSDNTDKNIYSSDSFYLCAFLLSKGMSLIGIEKTSESKKLEFLFEDTTYREALIHDFYYARRDDPMTLVDARTFTEAIKNLKERMHQI